MRASIPLAALVILCLEGCVDSLPRIGRGLPSNIEQARIAFDERVKERFPVGSNERALREELQGQRFAFGPSRDPSRGGYSATYEAEQLVCRVTYIVSWSAEAGRITQVGGERRDVCL
jgi:hypothetical protein